MNKAENKNEVTEQIHIAPPNIRTGEVWIKGTAPLVIHKFSDKAKNQIMEKQAAGSTANTKKKREAKDFDAAFNAARHISFDGWDGIPASSSARTAGIATRGLLSSRSSAVRRAVSTRWFASGADSPRPLTCPCVRSGFSGDAAFASSTTPTSSRRATW